MRVPQNLRPGQFSFNMTPMIDVVFLLIIFFLVSSHLAKQEVQLPLPLPSAESGEELREQARLTVNVLADGTLLLAGRKLPAGELTDRFRSKLAESGQDLEVVIRSDRSVPYAAIEPILLSCVRAGIWNFTFAVYRPEDVR